MNKFLAPIGIVVLVGGMVALGAVLSKQEQPTGTLLSAQITADDHAKGNPQSPVQIIEYGDMQCPACASYEDTIDQLLANNSNDFYFAYRHLPLKSIHPNAEEGAWAVEAAHKQGKFWEMKSLLYERQSQWSAMPDPSGKFMEYAAELGLNQEQFQSAYYSDEVHADVESDYRTATEAGFNSTPTFALNGKKISNPKNYDEFVQLIKSAAADSTQGQ